MKETILLIYDNIYLMFVYNFPTKACMHACIHKQYTLILTFFFKLNMNGIFHYVFLVCHLLLIMFLTFIHALIVFVVLKILSLYDTPSYDT